MNARIEQSVNKVDIKAISIALGKTKRGVEIRATKEAWPFEVTAVRGGKKRLYPLSSLPKNVKIKVVEHLLKGATGNGRQAEGDGISGSAGSPAGSGRGCAGGTSGGAVLRGNPLAGGSAVLPLDGRLAGLVPVASGNQLGSHQCARGNGEGNLIHACTDGAGEQPNALVPLGKDTALKDWQRECATARLALLHELARLATLLNSQELAITQLIGLASSDPTIGRLASQANAKQGDGGNRTLSATTLKRWKSAIAGVSSRSKQVAALAPKHSESMRIPAYAPYLMPLYQRPQKPTLKKCLEELAEVLPANIQVPSYWAARRFLDKMSKLDLERGRMLPRELKNVRAFVRRDTSHMWPGDCYTSDGHAFDAEIAHPRHGRPFRPEITTVLDVATRKCCGWSVDLAESTWAVLDAMRHAVETCGIQALHYVDNGSGQKNALMTDEVTGFMARLGITITHSLPYNSQARGLEERSHQTIWVRGAKELPTYIGASMDREAKQSAFKITRRDINAVGTSRMLMPFSTFLKWCEKQVDDYNNRPHRALPKIADPITGRMRHQSPNEAWEGAKAEGWEPVMVSKEEAVDLFRPYKIGKTHRAEVRLFGNLYFHPALEHHHGEQVRIGYDIHDGSRVWVRDMEGRLICIAEFEANKRAYFPQSQIDMAAQKRAEGRIKRAQAKINEAEEELNPTLVIEHQQSITVPVFDFKETELPVFNPIQGVEPIQAEPLPQGVAALPVQRPAFSTDAAKYRWLKANPREVTDQDNTWLDWYCNTSEWEDLFGDGFPGTGKEAAAR